MTLESGRLSRRAFVFGISAAAGGLALRTASPAPLASPVAHETPALSSEITAWIVIEPDDTTVIRVARSEMGQRCRWLAGAPD